MAVMTTPPWRWTWRQRLQVLGYGVSLLIFLAGLWITWKWRSRPAYWDRNQGFLAQTDSDTVRQLADDVERRLLDLVMDAQPGRVAKLTLSREQINAWMAQRMTAWAANQGYILPPQLGGYMVNLEEGQIVLAFEHDNGSVNQIVSLRFELMMESAGGLHAHLTQLRAGDLPIPSSWLVDRVRSMGDQGQAQVVAKLMEGVTFDPVWRHPASRSCQIRIAQLAIQPDRVTVELRMEPRP
ncbi:MAG: hypothetical protein IT440_05350 [Phycisphaeraceae bacterium]|nr:hypothetical protein [Phycisphaeraceae bacterium]